MSRFKRAVPVIFFLAVTWLDSTSQRFGVTSGTLTTLGEVVLWGFIAFKIGSNLQGPVQNLFWAPVGLALGDLAYGFNHYIIRIAYEGTVGPLTYAIPYVGGLSVGLYFLYQLCKQPKESKAVITLGYVLSFAVFALNVHSIVIPSLLKNDPPLPTVIAGLTAVFSAVESGLVGFSAILLVITSSVPIQLLLMGTLVLTLSDIALRYQSVYQSLLGMTVFENGWFFGLSVIASSVVWLFQMKPAELSDEFKRFMRFFSIRAMTAGYVLVGLSAVWLALTIYFQSLHIPNQLSASLLIALGVFGFAILVANFVDRNLSRITFRLSENQAIDRSELPSRLPQEIRAIVEYFQTLNGKISAERDHTLSLSSKIAHNIKSPITALRVARYSLAQHMKGGCTCCSDLQEQITLLDVSSKTITEIANQLLKEKRRLIGLETISNSLANAVTLTAANFPEHQIIIESSPHAAATPAAGLTEVMMNLIANAAEASEPAKAIRVEAREEGERITVMVIDQGRGIPEPVLRQLRRGQAVTTKTFGNGIGFASMIDWAKERGYELDIRSSTDPGSSGTSISIFIPMSLSAEPPAAVSQ